MWPFRKRGRDRASVLADAARAARKKDWPRAVELYRQFLAQHPERTDARLNLGAALYQLGRYGEALQEFEQVVRAAPQLSQAWLNLAAAANQLGLLQRAADALERAAEQDPKLPGLHYNMAILRLKQGKVAEALAELETELSLHPGNAPARRLVRALERRILPG